VYVCMYFCMVFLVGLEEQARCFSSVLGAEYSRMFVQLVSMLVN
jgi:hypothetical protein